MAEPPVAWVLNLDGDEEIAAGHRRDPFVSLERRPALRGALHALIGDDVVLGRSGRAPAGALGRAFVPTPSALAALARAGAEPPVAPGADVLRRVADRRFALALPGGVPGSSVITHVDEARQVVASLGADGRPWVAKRLFGFAGRGRLLRRGRDLEADAASFVARALRDDGALVIEPWLERRADLAIHGHVGRDGAVAIGRPTVQETTPAGAWVASRPATADDLHPGEARMLHDLAVAAAGALAGAGAWGPFGVDAMRALVDGAEVLVRCEVNPRYTMGWAVGMGTCRPDRPGRNLGSRDAPTP